MTLEDLVKQVIFANTSTLKKDVYKDFKVKDNKTIRKIVLSDSTVILMYKELKYYVIYANEEYSKDIVKQRQRAFIQRELQKSKYKCSFNQSNIKDKVQLNTRRVKSEVLDAGILILKENKVEDIKKEGILFYILSKGDKENKYNLILSKQTSKSFVNILTKKNKTLKELNTLVYEYGNRKSYVRNIDFQ